jgi:hypothetical protein
VQKKNMNKRVSVKGVEWRDGDVVEWTKERGGKKGVPEQRVEIHMNPF